MTNHHNFNMINVSLPRAIKKPIYQGNKAIYQKKKNREITLEYESYKASKKSMRKQMKKAGKIKQHL